jgi:Methylated DNA-protein cysteine methyltransferase
MLEKSDLPVFAETKKWLDLYFSGKKPAISELPLAPGGNEFRRAVWDVLCEIPYGKCVTYGEIARKIAVGMGKKICPAKR